MKPTSAQEILTKAIEKAIAGGWKQPDGRQLDRVMVDIYWKRDDKKRLPRIHQEAESLIFNHDFAKALWSIYAHCVRCHEDLANGWHKDDCKEKTLMLPAWQFHLQQMVIADDSIAYLGENI